MSFVGDFNTTISQSKPRQCVFKLQKLQNFAARIVTYSTLNLALNRNPKPRVGVRATLLLKLWLKSWNGQMRKGWSDARQQQLYSSRLIISRLNISHTYFQLFCSGLYSPDNMTVEVLWLLKWWNWILLSHEYFNLYESVLPRHCFSAAEVLPFLYQMDSPYYICISQMTFY